MFYPIVNDVANFIFLHSLNNSFLISNLFSSFILGYLSLTNSQDPETSSDYHRVFLEVRVSVAIFQNQNTTSAVSQEMTYDKAIQYFSSDRLKWIYLGTSRSIL